jgi:hypothetical protein
MKEKSRFTAIQLRDDDRLRCSIIYGQPSRIFPGMLGKIALVEDGRLMGYHIVNGNRERAFLFRTDLSGGAQKISGVFPAVSLLVMTRSRFRSARLLAALHEFAEAGVPLESVPEHCVALLNALLEGRGCNENEIRKFILRCQS